MNLARKRQLAFVEMPIVTQRRGRRKGLWRLLAPRAMMARGESEQRTGAAMCQRWELFGPTLGESWLQHAALFKGGIGFR